jgi:rhodanese-related sulfurtransferase
MAGVIDLSPETVHAALEAGEILLVDVRETYEFDAVRIDGAVNLPLSTFDPGDLPSEPGKRVVLSCAGGVRSVNAANLAQAAGVDVHEHLAGGIKAWMAAGLPVQS